MAGDWEKVRSVDLDAETFVWLSSDRATLLTGSYILVAAATWPAEQG